MEEVPTSIPSRSMTGHNHFGEEQHMLRCRNYQMQGRTPNKEKKVRPFLTGRTFFSLFAQTNCIRALGADLMRFTFPNLL
jgi:hypothetical protein